MQKLVRIALRLGLVVACVCLAGLAGVARGQGSLHYTVTVHEGQAGRLDVRLDVVGGEPGPLHLALPIWGFGGYELLQDSQGIVDVAATGPAGAIGVARDGEQGWLVARTGQESVSVTWKVRDLRQRADPRGYVMREAMLLEGTRVLLYPRRARALPCILELQVPAGWKVAASLLPAKEAGKYAAASYDRLVDAVVFCGDAWQKTLVINGVPHRLVLDWRGSGPAPGGGRLEELVKKVVQGAVKVLGSPPYKQYLLLFVGQGTGSRAHRNGAAVGLGSGGSADSLDLVRAGAQALVQTWNGTRLSPAELRPLRWNVAPRTRSLWMSAGASAYLADLVLLRAGLVTRAETLRNWSQLILNHRNHPLATRMAPADASWKAWDQDAAAGTRMDPVLQGRLLAFLLDLRLRSATAGARGLPDLVRLGLERFAGEHGYSPKDLEQLCSEVAGQDQSQFFKNHVRQPGSLPWDSELPRCGLSFEWFQWRVRDPGLRGVMRDGLLVVGPLDETSALSVAGLRPGDQLLSINQNRVRTPDDVDRVLAKLKPRQKLRLDLRHAGKLRNIRLTLEDDVALVIPVEDRARVIYISGVPAGPLQDAGILPGDQLEKIDKHRITRTQDVLEALRRTRRGQVLLTIRRAGKRLKVRVKAPPRHLWRGSLQEDPAASRQAKALLKTILGKR